MYLRVKRYHQSLQRLHLPPPGSSSFLCKRVCWKQLVQFVGQYHHGARNFYKSAGVANLRHDLKA